MMITSKNITNHELIGLRVKIVSSKNKSLVGVSGKVVDETKNTLIIKKKGKERKVIKETSDFVFTVEKKKIKVKGSLLLGAPWDRLKKKVKVKTRWQKV